jgi:hypothetical protein
VLRGGEDSVLQNQFVHCTPNNQPLHRQETQLGADAGERYGFDSPPGCSGEEEAERELAKSFGQNLRAYKFVLRPLAGAFQAELKASLT